VTLNVCAHCTSKFSVGALHCPQCGNADYYEEGTMPKITRHGGPSYAGEPGGEVHVFDISETEVTVTVEESAEPDPTDPYEGLLREDLKKLLDERGLPTSGNKPELVARLLAADEEAEVEEDQESEEPDSE